MLILPHFSTSSTFVERSSKVSSWRSSLVDVTVLPWRQAANAVAYMGLTRNETPRGSLRVTITEKDTGVYTLFGFCCTRCTSYHEGPSTISSQIRSLWVICNLTECDKKEITKRAVFEPQQNSKCAKYRSTTCKACQINKYNRTDKNVT